MIKNTKHPGNDAYFGEITDLNENEKRVIGKELNIYVDPSDPHFTQIHSNVDIFGGLAVNGDVNFFETGNFPRTEVHCYPTFRGSKIVGDTIVSEKTKVHDSGAFVVEDGSNRAINTEYTLNSIISCQEVTREDGVTTIVPSEIHFPTNSGTLALVSDINDFWIHTITFSGDGGKKFTCTFFTKEYKYLNTKEKVYRELRGKTIAGFGTDGTNLLFATNGGDLFIKADGYVIDTNNSIFNRVDDTSYEIGYIDSGEEEEE